MDSLLVFHIVFVYVTMILHCICLQRLAVQGTAWQILAKLASPEVERRQTCGDARRIMYFNFLR